MNVKVNDSCIACGACESICDAVFSVEDIAVVNEAAVADNEDCVKEAADACPVGAITIENGAAVVNADSCIDCGACEGACPTGAIAAE